MRRLTGLPDASRMSAPSRRSDDPVALLEIGDAVGERRERQRIGAEIHFAVAIADRERRALARADQEIVFALEQIDEREGAAQTLERRVNRLGRRFALRELVFDHEGGDLGVRLGRERIALRHEFIAQRLEVLDDAVVDDREPARGVGMGVGLGRLAMRRPAGVADADRARERRGGELGLEVSELALGPPAFKLAVLKRRDARGIIAAVFEALQRIDNRACDRPRPQNAHNAAHPRSLQSSRFEQRAADYPLSITSLSGWMEIFKAVGKSIQVANRGGALLKCPFRPILTRGRAGHREALGSAA